MTYDLTAFMSREREQPMNEFEIADVAEALACVLNSLICVSHRQPDMIRNAEIRFGMAQVELAELARELRA